MKESQIERLSCDYGRSLGFLIYKFNSTSDNGVPDRMVINKDEVFFIEFKTPKGKLSPMQIYQIRRIRRKGIQVYLIDSVEKAYVLFNNILLNRSNVEFSSDNKIDF